MATLQSLVGAGIPRPQAMVIMNTAGFQVHSHLRANTPSLLTGSIVRVDRAEPNSLMVFSNEFCKEIGSFVEISNCDRVNSFEISVPKKIPDGMSVDGFRFITGGTTFVVEPCKTVTFKYVGLRQDDDGKNIGIVTVG